MVASGPSGAYQTTMNVVLLLISAALVATMLVGVEEGASGKTHPLDAAGFIFLVSFTVYARWI